MRIYSLNTLTNIYPIRFESWESAQHFISILSGIVYFEFEVALNTLLLSNRIHTTDKQNKIM